MGFTQHAFVKVRSKVRSTSTTVPDVTIFEEHGHNVGLSTSPDVHRYKRSITTIYRKSLTFLSINDYFRGTSN